MSPREASADTRRQLMDAALETLKTEGIKGTTARAIAATGDVNQALIFYHFGGVMELLIAAATDDAAKRAERYRERLEGVEKLTELVAVARELQAEDQESGGIAVFTQMLAGTAGQPEYAEMLWEGFVPWIDVVSSALDGPLSTTGFGELVDKDDLAYSVVALFMGIELLAKLNPDRSPTEALMGTFEQLGGLVENVFGQS